MNNRDASIIGQSGTDSAINAGSYTIKWELIDTNNYQWTDGTISSKSESWTISKANSASAYKISDKVYTGSVLSGVNGNGVDWTGTPTATEPGTYKAIATPDSNHTWSDGTTVSKEFTWSIFQSWTKYKVRCITDSNGKPVQPNDTISNNGNYKFQEIIFEVKTSDTEPHTFCVGNSLTSEQNILHNDYTSGVYYWENNSWVKKKFN